jgi:hypothetical protein
MAGAGKNSGKQNYTNCKNLRFFMAFSPSIIH